MLRVSQAFALTALVAVAACTTKPKEVAVAPPPPPVVEVPVYHTPAISPINRGLSSAATVWHMRAALNVAALACRGSGEAAIIQRYNAMLAKHKASLAGAQVMLAAEFKAGGGDWQDRYDDSMTRLYNFFSQAQARDAFCTAAAATLAEAETLAPGELPTYAAAVLPTLDAPFAAMLAPRPVIAIAAASTQPAPAPVAGAIVTPAPPAAPARAVAAPPVVVKSAPAPKPAVTPPLPAVATRTSATPPMPAVGTRAPVAPAQQTRPVPRIDVDLSTLQD